MEPPQIIIGPAQAPAQDNVQHPDHGDIRPPKPDTFDGKGNVDLWTFTIQAYLVVTIPWLSASKHGLSYPI
eukprot:jgi/Chrzof1/9219/Cz03g40110.t1